MHDNGDAVRFRGKRPEPVFEEIFDAAAHLGFIMQLIAKLRIVGGDIDLPVELRGTRLVLAGKAKLFREPVRPVFIFEREFKRNIRRDA